MTIDGARYLSLDDEEYIINITDSEGKVLAVENIAEDCVLSISKSKDGEVISAVVSDKKVTGEIKLNETHLWEVGNG